MYKSFISKNKNIKFGYFAQHLSEELEAYFNSYENKVSLGEYQFKLHKLPGEI